MTDIVQQGGKADSVMIRVRNERVLSLRRKVLFVDTTDNPACNSNHAQRVIKTRVNRCRVDQIGKPSLPDIPQALQERAVQDRDFPPIKRACTPDCIAN